METKRKTERNAINKSHRLIGTLLALVLTAALAVSLSYAVDMKENYQRELDSIYKKSYYEAMDSLADVELKLSKLAVSEGASTQKTLLSEVWMNSEIAGNNIAQLSSRDGNMETIIKFLNQLGDYCHYLSKRISTEALTEAEKNKLDDLYKIVQSLQESFSAVQESVMNNAVLTGKLGEGIRLLGDSYDHFNNDSNVDYPEMIYDGPFSDGITVRNAEYLNGMPEVSEQEAQTKMGTIFPDLQNLNYLGKNEGSIPCYMYQTRTAAGEGTAQISVKGGLLVQFSSYRESGEATLDKQECKTKAAEYIQAMGYADMQPVWATEIDSAVYINYAYVKDGIIFYPDLVKVKIASADGALLAFDATGYAYNHIERTLTMPTTPIETARAKVSNKLTITEARTVLIPTEWNSEVLCYEFVCTYNEDNYYVYVDAATQDEMKVMKEIDGLIA